MERMPATALWPLILARPCRAGWLASHTPYRGAAIEYLNRSCAICLTMLPGHESLKGRAKINRRRAVALEISFRTNLSTQPCPATARASLTVVISARARNESSPGFYLSSVTLKICCENEVWQQLKSCHQMWTVWMRGIVVLVNISCHRLQIMRWRIVWSLRPSLIIVRLSGILHPSSARWHKYCNFCLKIIRNTGFTINCTQLITRERWHTIDSIQITYNW